MEKNLTNKNTFSNPKIDILHIYEVTKVKFLIEVYINIKIIKLKQTRFIS